MIISVRNKDFLTTFEKKLILGALRLDKIIAFPTDTIYGFGVNGLSRKAVENLYSLKHRNENKPLVLLSDSVDKIIPYIKDPDDTVRKLMQTYWPGPFTLILPYHGDIPLFFSLVHTNIIGVRIPNYPLLLDLLAYLPFPVVTTSANTSGSSPCIDGQEIESNLHINQSDLAIILDEGELTTTSPSTILEYREGKLIILRKGETILNE